MEYFIPAFIMALACLVLPWILFKPEKDVGNRIAAIMLGYVCLIYGFTAVVLAGDWGALALELLGVAVATALFRHIVGWPTFQLPRKTHETTQQHTLATDDDPDWPYYRP